MGGFIQNDDLFTLLKMHMIYWRLWILHSTNIHHTSIGTKNFGLSDIGLGFVGYHQRIKMTLVVHVDSNVSATISVKVVLREK